ncbi:transglutaminase-like domain-containing protein [Microbacterium aurum]
MRHVPAVAEYGAVSLTPGRPIREAATDLMQRIFRDFDYDKTATTVTSSVADAMAARACVCQDFAHVALACLRSHGIAARYVSGYLATQPPPGKERVFGADASHAWLAVWAARYRPVARDRRHQRPVGRRPLRHGGVGL